MSPGIVKKSQISVDIDTKFGSPISSMNLQFVIEIPKGKSKETTEIVFCSEPEVNIYHFIYSFKNKEKAKQIQLNRFVEFSAFNKESEGKTDSLLKLDLSKKKKYLFVVNVPGAKKFSLSLKREYKKDPKENINIKRLKENLFEQRLSFVKRFSTSKKHASCVFLRNRYEFSVKAFVALAAGSAVPISMKVLQLGETNMMQASCLFAEKKLSKECVAQRETFLVGKEVVHAATPLVLEADTCYLLHFTTAQRVSTNLFVDFPLVPTKVNCTSLTLCEKRFVLQKSDFSEFGRETLFLNPCFFLRNLVEGTNSVFIYFEYTSADQTYDAATSLASLAFLQNSHKGVATNGLFRRIADSYAKNCFLVSTYFSNKKRAGESLFVRLADRDNFAMVFFVRPLAFLAETTNFHLFASAAVEIDRVELSDAKMESELSAREFIAKGTLLNPQFLLGFPEESVEKEVLLTFGVEQTVSRLAVSVYLVQSEEPVSVPFLGEDGLTEVVDCCKKNTHSGFLTFPAARQLLVVLDVDAEDRDLAFVCCAALQPPMSGVYLRKLSALYTASFLLPPDPTGTTATAVAATLSGSVGSVEVVLACEGEHSLAGWSLLVLSENNRSVLLQEPLAEEPVRTLVTLPVPNKCLFVLVDDRQNFAIHPTTSCSLTCVQSLVVVSIQVPVSELATYFEEEVDELGAMLGVV